MKALIYGHSQSGGMGLDFEKILKTKGFQVKRVTKVGFNDYALKKGIPEFTGDPKQYDVVYYFGGGNLDKPTPDTLKEIVALLGGKEKVTVILPPYNSDKVSQNIMSDPTTKGYINQTSLESEGIKVYRQVFPAGDFWPDRIHLKPHSKSSVEFASMVLNHTEFQYAAASISLIMVLVAFLISKRIR